MTPEQRDDVLVVLRARLAVARVTTGKAQSLLDRVCADGRLRGILAYYAAHTGRWAGRGFQPQNLPRARDLPEDIYDTPENAPRVAQDRDLQTAEVLGSLLRGCVHAAPVKYLAVGDYSQVEARVLLWMAGDEANLEPYRRGEDPYRRLGARIWSCEPDAITKAQRSICKVIILACGFGGGDGALTAYAEKMSVDLTEAGISPKDLVDGWRDAHHLVAGARRGVWTTPDGRQCVVRRGGMWKKLQAAAIGVAQRGESGQAARCSLRRVGADMGILLPSGRELIYREARYQEMDDRWGGRSMSITYRHPRGNVVSTYGGRLAENVVQAAARDLLAEALVTLEREGLRPVLHVHDEIICEVDHESDLERVEEIMRRVPPWAEGLPVDVEGCIGRRYSK